MQDILGQLEDIYRTLNAIYAAHYASFWTFPGHYQGISGTLVNFRKPFICKIRTLSYIFTARENDKAHLVRGRPLRPRRLAGLLSHAAQGKTVGHMLPRSRKEKRMGDDRIRAVKHQKEGRRTARLIVRLTPEELEHLKKRAEEDSSASFRKGKRGTNYSGYYRAHLLSETNYKNAELLRIQKRLAYEIRKIGVNINQATKRINAGYGIATDAWRLQESLAEVERLFEKTIKECRRLWESQN